jgi:thiamine-phosphate pyrophosphorylase
VRTFDLYLITDPEASPGPGGIARAVRQALAGVPAGRVAVQLRAKQLTEAELLPLARELRAITRDAGVELYLNTHVELAQLTAADGVHLPERGPSPSATRLALPPTMRIGVSCHDATGLSRARREGADFAVLGPIFAVPGKAPPLGIERFAELVRGAGAGLPVYALGGVDVTHVAQLCAAGAHGIALVRAVFTAADPAAALAQCLTALDRARARNE